MFILKNTKSEEVLREENGEPKKFLSKAEARRYCAQHGIDVEQMDILKEVE